MPERAQHRGRPPNLYRVALTPEERKRLAGAERAEGLRDEIAVLRVRLISLAEKKPEEFELLRRGVETLVRALAADYRMSPRARRELGDRIAAVVNSIGDQLKVPD
jgi:hypothetical protein